MGELRKALSAQKQRGILISRDAIQNTFPFDTWYNALSSPSMLGDKAYLASTREGRFECIAKQMRYSKPFCTSPEGRVVLDYYNLLLAYIALYYDDKCPIEERNLVRSLTYAVGLEQLKQQLAALEKALNRNSCVHIGFGFRDGVPMPDSGNRIYNMNTLVYLLDNPYKKEEADMIAEAKQKGIIIKPGKYQYFRVTADDAILPAIFVKLYGYADEEIPYMLKDPRYSQLLTGIPNYYALRLAPYVLKGDYRMSTKMLQDTIRKYLAGQLLGRRESARGRKPQNLTNIYTEQVYPEVEACLDNRLALVQQGIANAGLTKLEARIAYVNPTYFIVCVKANDPRVVSAMSGILSQVKAEKVARLTPATIASGAFL